MKQEAKDKMVNTIAEKKNLGLTICWNCVNAGKMGCEWFIDDKPVPGWDAEKVPYIMVHKSEKYYRRFKTETYVVRHCPKFKKIER